jgi:hypothetical protein
VPLNRPIGAFVFRPYGYRDKEYFRLKILTCMLPDAVKITYTIPRRARFPYFRRCSLALVVIRMTYLLAGVWSGRWECEACPATLARRAILAQP